jgi:hypothetical protein
MLNELRLSAVQKTERFPDLQPRLRVAAGAIRTGRQLARRLRLHGSEARL